MIIVIGYNSAKPPQEARKLLGGSSFLHMTTCSPVAGSVKFITRDSKYLREPSRDQEPFLTSDEIKWTQLENFSVGEI